MSLSNDSLMRLSFAAQVVSEFTVNVTTRTRDCVANCAILFDVREKSFSFRNKKVSGCDDDGKGPARKLVEQIFRWFSLGFPTA